MNSHEDHYRMAERLVTAADYQADNERWELAQHLTAMAQVHATLATVHQPDRVFFAVPEMGVET